MVATIMFIVYPPVVAFSVVVVVGAKRAKKLTLLRINLSYERHKIYNVSNTGIRVS